MNDTVDAAVLRLRLSASADALDAARADAVDWEDAAVNFDIECDHRLAYKNRYQAAWANAYGRAVHRRADVVGWKARALAAEARAADCEDSYQYWYEQAGAARVRADALEEERDNLRMLLSVERSIHDIMAVNEERAEAKVAAIRDLPRYDYGDGTEYVSASALDAALDTYRS